MYSHLTDNQRTSGPVKATLLVFFTVRQSNMHSHLTDYQRTICPVKATMLVLSLRDHQTCTVDSLITRGPVILLKQIVGFITVGQSNMYSQPTDYQRTNGPVKATLSVLSLRDNQTCIVTSLITRGSVVLLRQLCRFCHCETIKPVPSPHWLPEDQWSCKSNIVDFGHCETIKHVQSPHWLPDDQWSLQTNIVGFVTVRQSTIYSHLTDYQRTRGPVKTTLLVLSLWDNQTCTVTSLITRGPVVM